MKEQSPHEVNDHVTFDEEVIAEHDKDRGTRKKIDEPKTPYQFEEASSQSSQQCVRSDINEDVQMKDEEQKAVEDEIKRHLEQAEKNKLINA